MMQAHSTAYHPHTLTIASIETVGPETELDRGLISEEEDNAELGQLVFTAE